MRIACAALCAATLIGSASAMARPVSYPGGYTFMQMNDADSSSLHLHYSPTARYSVGYKAEYWNTKEWQFHGLQMNYLLGRDNQPESQANIYLKSAAGIVYSDDRQFDGKTQGAGFIGIAADWENRRFFTGYENRLTYAGDIERSYMHKARLGIAPYIGDYGDLHSWLMLQIDHTPEKDDPITLTPMVRFFKGEYLAEAGVSDEGDIMFNWIIRY